VTTAPPPTAPEAAPSRNDRRLLWFVLLNVLAANVGFKLIAHFVFHSGIDEMRVRYWDFFHFQQFTDSWTPMLGSVDSFLANPTLPIYQAKLYDTLIYPLTSILPLLWMRQAGMSDAAVFRTMMLLSWLAVCAVVAIAVAIAAKVVGPRQFTWRAALATAIAAFFFMPITLAFSLGQAQIFLDLFFALLIFFWVQGKERPAGAMMALLAMVKPQFGLLLLWAALRRRWNALIAGAITLALGAIASVAAFGVRNNLDYAAVMSGLSRKAQSHYANQSMFGLLNRAIFNGENIPYHPYVYPPFVPWVYYVTLATTAALVLFALAFPWRERAGAMPDLSTIGIVCVIATPMAWEHHYGVMLGIFVWLWFAVYRPGPYLPGVDRPGPYRRNSARVWPLALAFILIADFLSPFNFFSAIPIANILQSYMYFGALLLIGLLTGAGVLKRDPNRDLLQRHHADPNRILPGSASN
jgi:hypothetical protein